MPNFVATRAAETLEAALAAYARAQSDIAADTSTRTRLAARLTAAATHLSEALAAAEGPIGQLETLPHNTH